MIFGRHLAYFLPLLLAIAAQAQDFSDFEDLKEVPAARNSLLTTAEAPGFRKPLYFDQVDRGVVLAPLELDYDLTGGQGNLLRVGNATVSEASFSFALMPLGKAHPRLATILSPTQSQGLVLMGAFPDFLSSGGTLEMISRTGTVLWAHKVTAEDIIAWQGQVEAWRKTLLNQGASVKQLRGGIFATRWGLMNIDPSGVPFGSVRDNFKFCFSQEAGRNSSRICSVRYGVDRSKEPVKIAKVRVDKIKPRVMLKNELAPLKQIVQVSRENPTSFYAELENGISYEFVSLPHRFELMDIADTDKPGILRIVGFDVRPLGRSEVLNPDQYGKITRFLGFEATIGDTRKFWAAPLAVDNPVIYLPGEGGGVFKQRFVLSEIPQARSRIFLSDRTPTGTYRDGIKLFGKKLPQSKVASTQNSVESEEGSQDFMWRFKATERGQINRAYLDVENDGKTYHSYFELYKGYPREISGRFSGVQTKASMIIMGEVAYNQWFEDILGWSNYWISRQRWGVSAKYFQSFNNLQVKADEQAKLSALNVDLKYRFTPGLWGRDETLGVMASFQEVTFGPLSAPMVGMGGFWARSMPKVLDDWFNLLPAMNYPKWVNVEFIYYAASMKSNVELNASMSLNFQGKVLWGERFFGEAGFGIKRYGFSDKTLSQKAELNTFYGTVGLGLNF